MLLKVIRLHGRATQMQLGWSCDKSGARCRLHVHIRFTRTEVGEYRVYMHPARVAFFPYELLRSKEIVRVSC